MVEQVVIVIGVVVVFSVVAAVGIVDVVNSIASAALAPHVKLLSPEFSQGPCQTSYFLWIFPTGQYRAVMSNFTLSNDGLTRAKVTISFTVDGSTVAQQDFFIAQGQTAQFTAQFQTDDCGAHQYWAQISNVQSA